MRNGWMKFMWPTWPIVGFSAASPVSTRLPPWRPGEPGAGRAAPGCRRRIRSTLTCRIMPPGAFMPRLTLAPPLRRAAHASPVAEERVQRRRVGARRERFAEARFGEHLRELGEQLQVLLGRLLGHEQHEDLRDGLAVRRVERDRRLAGATNAPCASREALDAAVRNRDALARARSSPASRARAGCRRRPAPRESAGRPRTARRPRRTGAPSIRASRSSRMFVGRQQLGDLVHRVGRGVDRTSGRSELRREADAPASRRSPERSAVGDVRVRAPRERAAIRRRRRRA